MQGKPVNSNITVCWQDILRVLYPRAGAADLAAMAAAMQTRKRRKQLAVDREGQVLLPLAPALHCTLFWLRLSTAC